LVKNDYNCSITDSPPPLSNPTTCPWGTFAYRVFPFGLCNSPTMIQRTKLTIFFDLIHDCVEVYMDDFSLYGDSFNEALKNLEKILIRFQETNLALSGAQFHMLQTNGIFLVHFHLVQEFKLIQQILKSYQSF
jgi:hypothetical protein